MNSSDRQQTIQLLVGEDGNRAAVRELLSGHYDVITDQSVTDADCYLVDDHTFPDHHSDLLERVEQNYPVFCPVVVIRREDSSRQLTLANPGEREPPLLVNEIVDAPIDPPVLFRRLDTLLTRRQQSLELRHYITQLKESNKSLEQFAYAASHDLQEPLRMISSYLQLIEQRYGNELDEEVDEFIEFAIDGADRMRGMIDGLLEYSRIDTEGGQLTETDLNDVLEDVRADLQMKINEHEATITSDSLPRVEGDPDQLRQLFQNLLSNAIEYSGDDQPTVAVEAERSGAEWQISVIDDGIGIDPDDQERIFEVFQRLHSHDEYEGTGIGLALCKRIVERHGGRIWVESEPGDGSTFTFTLPAIDAPRG
ncbi:sensor histidine kinase [Natronorubrum daqingense]|uniref:histidine kinase n=1 Tax=Natronorubrum daqingense TaxID=588898 RepID=A0A1N7AG27_9EURY|nr:ATP-binding protein [Natronorubrum daqingense]APX97995.1 two-component sensor histidine kinase [Natronorubrum daqingense]SIR38032.1 His Kinase A (phospho-acceptor) domain-containing protein [Natronorubrum daqingense]